MELCAIYRTLLGDADGLYDPSQYNDRLLLGLKGTMSEAESRILKSRLQQGMWNKAERGEVLPCAIGYMRTIAGDFVIDPDEQVQAVVLLSSRVAHRGSMSGCCAAGASRREGAGPPHCGANRGELEWAPAEPGNAVESVAPSDLCRRLLVGRSRVDPRKKVPGKPTTGRTFRAHDECRVLIRDRFPAYIRWEDSKKTSVNWRKTAR